MNSGSSSRLWILVGGVVLLGLAGGYYVWQARSSSSSANPSTLPQVSVPTIGVSSSAQTVNTPNGSYTIEEVPAANIPAHPSIHRALTFAGDFSTDQQASITASIKVLEDRLKQDAADPGTWTNLGAIRKIIGDFEGAKQAWEYVAILSPKNTTPLYNLADLYGNFLKQYGTAEKYYKKVISIDPLDTNAYRNLFDLYNNVYKIGSGAAPSILKQGIAANPNAIDLHVLLARYYRAQNDTANAKVQYDAAITSAKDQNQGGIAEQIQQEEAEIK